MVNLNEILKPFWANSEMYQESVLFFESNGLLTGKLLFFPKKIQCIEIWGPQNDFEKIETYDIIKIEHQPGNNGAILSLKSPKIPSLKREEIIKPLGGPNSYPSTLDKKNGLLHSEEGLWHKLEARITYSHDEPWNGYIPIVKSQQLPNTKRVLHEQTELDIFVFGDSISTGANCSQMLKLNPFQGGYPELIQLILQEKYPNLQVRLKNASVGGQSSEWGSKELPVILDAAGDFRFDLNIIAWGANDSGGRRSARRFDRNIKTQIKCLLEKNPKAEFIIITSSLTNTLWGASHNDFLYAYQARLRKETKKWHENIVLADITQLWYDLFLRKDFYDLTGNGLNHPNDFGHRVYAQVITTLLINEKIAPNDR